MSSRWYQSLNPFKRRGGGDAGASEIDSITTGAEKNQSPPEDSFPPPTRQESVQSSEPPDSERPGFPSGAGYMYGPPRIDKFNYPGSNPSSSSPVNSSRSLGPYDSPRHDFGYVNPVGPPVGGFRESLINSPVRSSFDRPHLEPSSAPKRRSQISTADSQAQTEPPKLAEVVLDQATKEQARGTAAVGLESHDQTRNIDSVVTAAAAPGVTELQPRIPTFVDDNSSAADAFNAPVDSSIPEKNAQHHNRHVHLIAPPVEHPMASPGPKTKQGKWDSVFDGLIPGLRNDGFDQNSVRDEGPKGSTVKESGTKPDARKPTCSLNLVCYRSGSRGCELRQIRVVKRSMFTDDSFFQKAVKKCPDLISNDVLFFRALQEQYRKHMCGVWRRIFSLKTLRTLRLLSYTPSTRPFRVPVDDFTMQEVLFAYNHPNQIETDHAWVDWVFRLRQPDCRHALEFVEGWSGFRIAVAASIPLLISSLVGIIWTARGGDVQAAFTVATFLLTIGTALLALVAVLSGIES